MAGPGVAGRVLPGPDVGETGRWKRPARGRRAPVVLRDGRPEARHSRDDSRLCSSPFALLPLPLSLCPCPFARPAGRSAAGARAGGLQPPALQPPVQPPGFFSAQPPLRLNGFSAQPLFFSAAGSAAFGWAAADIWDIFGACSAARI